MIWHHVADYYDHAKFHVNAKPEVKWVCEHLVEAR